MGTSTGIALPLTGIGNLRVWVPTYISSLGGYVLTGYFENTTIIILTDIICPHRGALIPLLKNRGILGDVVHAQ